MEYAFVSREPHYATSTAPTIGSCSARSGQIDASSAFPPNRNLSVADHAAWEGPTGVGHGKKTRVITAVRSCKPCGAAEKVKATGADSLRTFD
jgi:hypothetical protein